MLNGCARNAPRAWSVMSVIELSFEMSARLR
jgi:hypothetical protein